MTRAGEILGCAWDVPTVSRRFGRQPDPVADARPATRRRPRPSRRADVHRSRAANILDTALARGKGVILLTSHFGGHLLPAHWLFRQGYPLRFYMERPRHVSRYLARQFADRRPARPGQAVHLAQGRPRRLRRLDPPRREVLNAGMIIYLAGDVRWTGPIRPSRPGSWGSDYHFSATWVNLAAMTGAAVVPVFCQMQPRRNLSHRVPPSLHDPSRRCQAAAR